MIVGAPPDVEKDALEVSDRTTVSMGPDAVDINRRPGSRLTEMVCAVASGMLICKRWT